MRIMLVVSLALFMTGCEKFDKILAKAAGKKIAESASTDGGARETSRVTAEGAVQFSSAPLEPGARVTLESEQEVSHATRAKKGSVSRKYGHGAEASRDATLEFVGMEGDASVWNVTVDEYVVLHERFGEAEEIRFDHIGETFELTISNDGLRIVPPDGIEVDDATRDVMKNVAEQLIRGEPLANFLAGKTVKRGQRVKVPNEVFASLLAGRSATADIEDATLQFTHASLRGEDEVGNFELRATYTTAAPPFTTITAQLKTEARLVVRAKDAMLLELEGDFEGRLEGMTEHDGDDVKLTGTSVGSFETELASSEPAAPPVSAEAADAGGRDLGSSPADVD